VQIGGGVHVGEAFQTKVGLQPIAIWVTVELCRNFSDGASMSRGFKQEKYEMGSTRLKRRKPRQAGGELDGM